MSLHDDVVQSVRSIIGEAQANRCEFISPSAIAVAVYGLFKNDTDDVHVAYLAVEQIKHVARKELATKLDCEGNENESMQDDMFSGQLQEHYPIQVSRGLDPQYVRRDLLTVEQLDFNIARLRKSAMARIDHAYALEAYRDQRANAVPPSPKKKEAA